MPHDSGELEIIRTDASCIIGGVPRPGLPTLVWQDGAIEVAATDWLRALAVDYGLPNSTLAQYAKVVRPFLRFCRARGRAWSDVDDGLLRSWQEFCLRTRKVKPETARYNLGTIFQFYVWAQDEAGLLRDHVATTREQSDLKDHIFAISARRQALRGRTTSEWKWPYLVSGSSSSEGRRDTPTEEQIRDIHVAASRREWAERNMLLYMWAEFAGPRRFEAIQIGRSHLPSRAKIAQLRENGGTHRVIVTRKGKRFGTWSLEAPADLLDATWDWVEGGLQELLEPFRRIRGWRQPDEIFLSSQTGKVLHPDSVTKIARLDFAEAGVSNASLHRLRARFAVNIVESELRLMEMSGVSVLPGSALADTLLTRAAARMGQSHKESLRPYLNTVLDRRTRNPSHLAIEDDRLEAAMLIRRLEPLLQQLSVIGPDEGLVDADLTREKALQLVEKLADQLRKAPNAASAHAQSGRSSGT
jgi:site-specific recombinase XerD